jgi:hypothetical protein
LTLAFALLASASAFQPSCAVMGHLGCFEDLIPQGRRVLPHKLDCPYCSKESCAARVAETVGMHKLKETAIGVEYGSECFYGTHEQLAHAIKKADAGCDMKCIGAPGETCGGNFRLEVFLPICQASFAELQISAHELEHQHILVNISSHSVHTPVELDLRLQGDHPMEGTLQIYHDGQWGAVCGGEWNAPNAEVACRQLGYGDASTMGQGTLFTGRHSRPMFSGDVDFTYDEIDQAEQARRGLAWIDVVECRGSEARLADCTFRGWGISPHTRCDGVTLRCTGFNERDTVVLSNFLLTFSSCAIVLSLVALLIAGYAWLRVRSLSMQTWLQVSGGDGTNETQLIRLAPVKAVTPVCDEYSQML